MSKKPSRYCVIIIDAEMHEHELVASAFLSHRHDVSVYPKQSAQSLFNQSALLEFFGTDAKQRHLTVIVPSEHTSCIKTRIHAKQIPFADKIIGSVIEEKLASDLEYLHVNLLHIDDDNLAYASAISRSYVHQINNLLPEQVEIDAVIPDAFCLPMAEDDVHIALIRNRIIIRRNAYEGAAYPFSAVDAVAHALAEEKIAHITVHHAADALGQVMIMQKIFAESESPVQVTAQQIAEPSMHNFIQRQYTQQHQAGAIMPNIMQPFKTTSGGADNITLAKRVAAGLGFLAVIDLFAVTLTCVVLFGFAWLLGVGSQSVVDKVAPQANLTYQELIDAAGQGGSESFSAMLANSLHLYSEQANNNSDIAVSYIRYNSESSELALRMTVPNFSVLQDYKSALEGAGYTAEVSANASPNNGQLVASVRISAGGYY